MLGKTISLMKKELQLRPECRINDLIKLIYQAFMGIEHLLDSDGGFQTYLFNEMDKVRRGIPDSKPLLENITIIQPLARMNLSAAVQKGITVEDVYSICFESAAHFKKFPHADFVSLVEQLPDYLSEAPFNYEVKKIDLFFSKYLDMKCPALHHSKSYRNAYDPHYRLINPNLIDKLNKTA